MHPRASRETLTPLRPRRTYSIALPGHYTAPPRRGRWLGRDGLSVRGEGSPLMWTRLWSIIHSVETIQVVLDEDLLRAADRAARRLKVNRSMLVRQALRAHLATLARRAREDADRSGYERVPDDHGAVWEKAAAWPEE